MPNQWTRLQWLLEPQGSGGSTWRHTLRHRAAVGGRTEPYPHDTHHNPHSHSNDIPTKPVPHIICTLIQMPHHHSVHTLTLVIHPHSAHTCMKSAETQ